MEQHRVLTLVGATLMVAGGIPAIIGTTSTGLFVLYCVVLLTGIAVAAYGNKLRGRG